VDTHSLIGTIKYPLPGATFMDMFGFTKEHLTRNVLALAFAPAAYLAVTFFVVLMSHKERR
jgi:hypothetical protein